MIQNNVVIVGLIVSMHFQQFEDHKVQSFLKELCPRTPLSPCVFGTAWSIIPTLIIWSQFLKYAPPPPRPRKILATGLGLNAVGPLKLLSITISFSHSLIF